MDRLKINKVFKPLYTSKKRYFLVTGGRGSLKSTTVHDFACRLTYEVGQGIMITRYTMTSAEKSIIPEFKETLIRNGSINNFHITRDRAINLLTGSFVLFTGIKTSSGTQTANLKSLAGITTWVIEEGEDFDDEKAFDTIDDSIRSNLKQNRVIWIQNPSTREHFIYKRWLEKSNRNEDVKGYPVTVSNHEDVEHIHSTYHIAEQYLSKSFLKKAEDSKESKPNWYYHNYIGGWLEKAEGVIFENWIKGKFDDTLPYVYGMDFGYVNDPTAITKVAVTNDKIYVKEMLYKTGLSTDGIIAAMQARDINKTDLIIADNAEPRLIAEIQQEGYNIIPCKKGKDSVRLGLVKMMDYTIVSEEDDYNMHTELNNYVWNDKRSNTPIDKFNHLIDSFRYAFDKLDIEDFVFI